jgi:hypothetical protein
MRIIVSDGGCLIDLRKASLLEAFLALPSEILIPNTLFADGLPKFNATQKKALVRGGLKVIDIPGLGVQRAREVMLANPQFSANDGFAYVVAETHRGCILLTGDDRLRAVAAANKITVQGVLWAVDQIHKNGHSVRACHKGLVELSNDGARHLPQRELVAAVKRFAALR